MNNNSNNNLQTNIDESTYNHHNFDLAKKKLRDFSKNTDKDFKLEKVEEEGGFFRLGNHNVTGSEFNLRLSKIQDKFININTGIIELRKEFGVVYTALESLDKDILKAFLVQLNQIKQAYKSIEVTNDKLLLANEDINNIIEKQRKTVEVLTKFKKRLDEYKHLVEVDNMWRDMNILKYDISELKKTDKKLSGLEHLYQIDEIWEKLDKIIIEIGEVSILLENQNRELVESKQRINSIEEFVRKISTQEYLFEIDTLWKENRDIKNKVEKNKKDTDIEILVLKEKIELLDKKINYKNRQIYIFIIILVCIILYILFFIGRR